MATVTMSAARRRFVARVVRQLRSSPQGAAIRTFLLSTFAQLNGWEREVCFQLRRRLVFNLKATACLSAIPQERGEFPLRTLDQLTEYLSRTVLVP